MDVKRIVGIVLLGCGLGIIFFVFYFLRLSDDEASNLVPSWGGRGPSYSGTVRQISQDAMTLHAPDDGEHVFRLDSNTRFFLWGNQMVREGTPVKVTYKRVHNGPTTYLLARDIRVLRNHATPSRADESATPDGEGPRS